MSDIDQPLPGDGATDAAKPAAAGGLSGKWRANYVAAPHFFNLNHACKLVNDAFAFTGHFGTYLVGSSLERRDYRDVDVRLIMPDAAYDLMFRDGRGENGGGWLNPFWSLLCSSISLWLSQQSGLPVDFQIQRQTQANEQHGRKQGCKRSALGMFLDYPGERPTDVAPATAAKEPA